MAFGIDDAIGAVASLTDDIIKRVFPDATEIEKAKLQQLTQTIQNEYALQLAQIDVNKVEATNPSIFVAGARPAAMWVSVITLAYSGIGVSFLSWLATCFGLPTLPIVDSTATNAILMGLLGLGGMRSFDKLKGTDTKDLSK